MNKARDINMLDAPRRRLLERTEELRTDLASLSRAIGKNATYLWQYIWRNNPQALPEGVRHELSAVTGIPEPELRSERLAELMKEREPRQIQGMLTIKTDLPVKGRVVPGAKYLAWEGGKTQKMVDRPTVLLDAQRGFTAYVYDESMAPRYEPGEKVYVDPDQPLSRNCYVFVVFTDDTAVIRQYLGFDNDTLLVRQLNPVKEFRFPRSEVQQLGRIVGSSER